MTNWFCFPSIKLTIDANNTASTGKLTLGNYHLMLLDYRINQAVRKMKDESKGKFG